MHHNVFTRYKFTILLCSFLLLHFTEERSTKLNSDTYSELSENVDDVSSKDSIPLKPNEEDSESLISSKEKEAGIIKKGFRENGFKQTSMRILRKEQRQDDGESPTTMSTVDSTTPKTPEIMQTEENTVDVTSPETPDTTTESSMPGGPNAMTTTELGTIPSPPDGVDMTTTSGSVETTSTPDGGDMGTTPEGFEMTSTPESPEMTSTTEIETSTVDELSVDFGEILNQNGACQDMCGKSAANRIVGGTKTTIRSHPWMVQILKKKTSFAFCGGTIIGKKYILTAAHCVKKYRKKPNQLAVRIAHTSNREPGTVVDVRKVYPHPRYPSKPGKASDIAVLVLEDELEFTADIRPICLPSSGSYDGMNGVITGWGTTEEGGQRSPTLEEANVQILEYESCVEVSSYPENRLNEKMICGTGVNKDTCQGDSGGPLALLDNGKFIQVGITAWGRGCARPEYPGVYTKISEFSKWIANKAKKDECFSNDASGNDGDNDKDEDDDYEDSEEDGLRNNPFLG